MTWWLSMVGSPVWVPTVEDFKSMPKYKAEAHRLFMAGTTVTLLRSAL